MSRQFNSICACVCLLAIGLGLCAPTSPSRADEAVHSTTRAAGTIRPATAPSGPPAGPEKGALLLCSIQTPDIRRRFIQLAGGPTGHFVVIANAPPADSRLLSAADVMALNWGVSHLQLCYAADSKAAADEAFLAALRQANGVWFTGGRPVRYVDRYLDSPAREELAAVLRRGGVIGGESAGAMVQASHLLNLSYPGRPEESVPHYYQGFGLLRSATVFPHFAGGHGKYALADGERMIADNPGLLGIGIDDGAAVIVGKDQLETFGAGEVTLLYRDADGRARSKTLGPAAHSALALEAPHAALMGTPLPQAMADMPTSQPAGLQEQIDRIAADPFHADAPGGAVLVVSHHRTLLRKGYGLANLELRVPVDPSQVFRIGSVTKQFTAVAVLQLVAAGKVRLDDDVKKYVPEFAATSQPITIANLLTHTSGVRSYTDEPAWPPTMRQNVSVKQILGFVKDKPLEFAPGTDWRYSNTNYILLGAVIERASGQSYAQYLRAHLFGPAGMTCSGYDDTARIIPGRVPGYSRTRSGWANAPYISMTQPYAAGGIVSTVDDLWKWQQALEAGRLLDRQTLAKAFVESHLADGRGTGYGYGWQVGTVAGHPTVEHGGSIPGFVSYVLRVPDADLFVAVLSNTDDKSAVRPDRIAIGIARTVLGPPTVAAVEVPEPTLRDYTGAYRDAAGSEFTVSLEHGRLRLARSEGRRYEPLATSQTEFLSPTDDTRFIFVAGAAKGVDHLLVHPRSGLEQVFKRES